MVIKPKRGDAESNINSCTCLPQNSLCLAADLDSYLHESCLWVVAVSDVDKDLGLSHASPLPFSILLYSQVREPQVMLEVGSSWLRAQANQSLPEYGTLLELYLAQVLLPLGRFEGAEELVRGCAMLGSEQQLEFLSTICESRCQWAQRQEMRSAAEEQQDPVTETLLGGLSLCCLCSFCTILFQAGQVGQVNTSID